MHADAAGDAARRARRSSAPAATRSRRPTSNAGQVVNTATGDSDQTPPTQSTETVPLPQAPALTLVKQGTLDTTVVAPNDRADAGDRVDYTLTATNAGNVTLTGVTVVDPKLGHARVRAAAAGDAGAGRADRLHRQLHADAGRPRTPARSQNTATADSDQTPPTQAPSTVPLPQAPALALLKQGTLDTTVVAPGNRADAGDKVDYTLTAANVGNVTLTGVTIVDPKLRHARLHAAAAGDAGAGRDARLHRQLHADPGRPQRRPGRRTRRRATATRRRRRIGVETVPLPQAPALALTKRGTLDMTVVAPADRADVGDKIDYTLTAINAGNVTLTGVTISRPEARHARLHAGAAGDAGAGRDARLHGELHADAGGPQQRPGRRTPRPRTATRRRRPTDGDRAAAAGSGADAGEGRRRSTRPSSRRTTGPTPATGSTTR